MAILNFILEHHDWEKCRYTFKCKWLPIKMICDWRVDGKLNKQDGEEGFMIREYYLFGKLIRKVKHTTMTHTPKNK
jgi:hypothetical protein